MFQYAAGRRLANHLEVDLKLDISGFSQCKLRIYYLGVFSIHENFASAEEIASLRGRKGGFADRFLRKYFKKPLKAPSTYYEEKHFQFDSEVLRLSNSVYLDGYWQSEKYFADIGEIIRREFELKLPQTGRNRELADLISSCESVSLHVRRGDYVSNESTKQYHGVCDMDYYFRAVKELSRIIQNPHVFIFSDEPEWAHGNLKLPYPSTIVSHNSVDMSHEDLRLMSQCRHHIIANSTFSWWGAWLGQNSDKVVVAPLRWFSRIENNAQDIIPSGWIRV